MYGEFARELGSLCCIQLRVSDLGWQTKIRMTGTDRIRWANGMLSNTVQSLPEGQGNYSFLLSSQGRILGDGRVYRRKDDLLFDTSLDQLPTLLKHLDHYIIMDDVELADVTGEWTALSLGWARGSAGAGKSGHFPERTAHREYGQCKNERSVCRRNTLHAGRATPNCCAHAMNCGFTPRKSRQCGRHCRPQARCLVV